ncbi:hypothetical protein BTJ68_01128 [Hortaea werneckii EXF-2000]|uniref:F-box domain-containing protein n=1 Tax=Hortaea werneckii EXF-2000 TaxID=1157616 RepID=A0A1Z5TRU9_HORWE|nr:hypothetical protein BTJ68_01128 [Hortaea werneckii EXF-2000]
MSGTDSRDTSVSFGDEPWEFISRTDAGRDVIGSTKGRKAVASSCTHHAVLTRSRVFRPSTHCQHCGCSLSPWVESQDQASDQEASPLFAKLPTEIRIYIYELLFQSSASDKGVLVRRGPGYSRPPSVLSLLLTCRRIINEAETIFYATNRLIIADPAFITHLSLVRRKAVSRITILASSAAATFSLLEPLHRFPNLTSLWIARRCKVQFIDVSSWRMMAKQMVDTIHARRQLQEVKVINLPTDTLSPDEEEMKMKLDEIDARLENAAQGRRS